MKNPPAFQFYPADFLADENVALMSLAGRGAYITLMCYCWREGSMPSDMTKLGRLCGIDGSAMAQLWDELSPCFEVIDDRYIHPRLNKERAKQVEHKEERSESGKRGALKRWGEQHKENKGDGSYGLAMAEPVARNSSSSSSSPSSSKEKKVSTKPQPDERSKHPAIVACRSVVNRFPDKSLYDRLIEVLGDSPDMVRLNACRQEWTKRGFNPNAWTWAIDWYMSGIPQILNGNGNGAKRNANTSNAANGNHRGTDSGDCGFQAGRTI